MNKGMILDKIQLYRLVLSRSLLMSGLSLPQTPRDRNLNIVDIDMQIKMLLCIEHILFTYSKQTALKFRCYIHLVVLLCL